MRRKFVDFIKSAHGSTAIEYSLIASLIAVVIVAAVMSLGTSLKGLFNTVASSM